MSLEELGITIKVHPIVGKKFWGYLRNLYPLYIENRRYGYDLMHAHYSLCGFLVWIVQRISPKRMGGRTPVVTSLMGSDVKGMGIWLFVVRLFVRHYWDATIVKSIDMHDSLGANNSFIIPNGVNLVRFREIDRNQCKNFLEMDFGSRYILFGADPVRGVKNYPLAQKAFDLLQSGDTQLAVEKCQLITLGSVPHEQVPTYLNACNVLLLTSRWEGSPNIIKEAMACGIPIVCTDVGDVRWLLKGLDGCYVTSQDPVAIADKLMKALQFEGRTKGRERLIELGLDSESVAKMIVALYEEVMEKMRRLS